MGKIVWLSWWNDDAKRRRAARWSSHRKHVKKKLAEPTTVYVIILLIAVSYVSITNMSKFQIPISGLATGSEPQPAPAVPTYTPPATPTGDCGAPCKLLDANNNWNGEIGVKDLNNQCIPIKKYYDERHCCVDMDCSVGQVCFGGTCANRIPEADVGAYKGPWKICIGKNTQEVYAYCTKSTCATGEVSTSGLQTEILCERALLGIKDQYPELVLRIGPEKINIRMRFLFIPIKWGERTGDLTNVQLNDMIKQQVNFFIQNTNLQACPEKVQYEVINEDCGVECYTLENILKIVKNKGYDVEDYDAIVGISGPKTKTEGIHSIDYQYLIAYYPDPGWQNRIFAHEMGHIFGLNEEYCSREAGTTDTRCSGPDSPNPLKAEYGCDPKDVNCCFQDCGKYIVCCEGNLAYDKNTGNQGPGRSIMSYTNAAGPRKYSKPAQTYLDRFPALNCVDET